MYRRVARGIEQQRAEHMIARARDGNIVQLALKVLTLHGA
jgi:hypothetical protein